MSHNLQVVTTLPSQQQAQAMARTLVERRLAACVQVAGPVESYYWWQDKLDTAQEWQLLIKTREVLYPELERAILQLHPYDTPEIIATPIVMGSASYLQWLERECGG